MIEWRMLQQKGQVSWEESEKSKVGISTTILAVHTFLVRFFNWYIQTYRE